jgi:predicted PolB exonuclease-like 3'-5' exonuclease
MTPVLAFDIETAPDCDGLRRLYELDPKLSDRDVAEIAFQRRRTASGSDFLQLHLHRVIAISCALRDESFRVWSLGTPEDSEADLIRRFFDGVEKYTPQLVSWNGGGFDLPVLHYRSLVHGIAAPRYWDQGEDERDFKWNNYISRYHSRHLDLMDLLALYQPRNNVPLDQMAKLIGFPGKLGMDGSQVWHAYREGRIREIRSYCETDAANTYLVYLRFQLLRGVFDAAGYQRESELVRTTLAKSPEPHWREFLEAWK